MVNLSEESGEVIEQFTASEPRIDYYQHHIY